MQSNLQLTTDVKFKHQNTHQLHRLIMSLFLMLFISVLAQSENNVIVDSGSFESVSIIDSEMNERSNNTLSSSPLSSSVAVITAVFDGPLSGGVPKGIEIYLLQDIPDMSVLGFGVTANGNGAIGEDYTIPASPLTSGLEGDYIYISNETTGFTSFFGFAPDYVTGTMSINGDDAIELYYSGTVIDVFGDVNTDGTGEDWEYIDGWASRVVGSGPDGSTFTIGNWSFSGPNALDGETTNASAENPVSFLGYTLVNNITQRRGYDGIQAAVNAATAGDVIDISSTYTHNGILTTVDKNLTINGNNASINAGFNITNGAEVTIEDLTIENIAAPAGFYAFNTSEGTTINQVGAGSVLTMEGVTITHTMVTGGVKKNLLGFNLTVGAPTLNLNNCVLNLTNESIVYGMYAQQGGPTISVTNTVYNVQITPAGLTNRSMNLIGHQITADNILADITLSGNTYNPTYTDQPEQPFYEILLYAKPSSLTNTQINTYLGDILTSGQSARIWYSESENLGASTFNVFPGDVQNATSEVYYPTIQDAINDANSGETIEIQVADFTEPGQIIIDKDLILQGMGKDNTILRSNINTASSGHDNDASAWIITESGTNVTIKDMTINASGNDTYTALRFYDDGLVDGVAFTEIKHSASPYIGIAVQVLNGEVDVKNSMFTEIGRIGVHYRNGVVPGAVISGTYDNNSFVGKGPGDFLDYAIDISGGTTITVTNSDISNNQGVASTDGSTSAGILITSYFPTPANSDPNDVTITGNDIYDNTVGIGVGYDTDDISDVTATENNIYDNDYGITSTGPEVNASLNW